MGRFIIVDGKITENNEVNLNDFILNKSFVFSLQFWFGFGGIPLFFENIDLLTIQLQKLNLFLPPYLTNKRELFRITKRMLNKNKFYRSGLIRIQVFSRSGSVSVLITSESFEYFDFPFSSNGLFLNFSEIQKLSNVKLSNYPFFNQTLWNTAESEILNSSFQNTVIFNEKGFACECIRANIFMASGNTIYTPSLQTGCYEDILRKPVIETAESLSIRIIESEKISKEDLLKMNEIFIASEVKGIQWILGVENKRFVHNFSVEIHEMLNEYLKKKVV